MKTKLMHAVVILVSIAFGTYIGHIAQVKNSGSVSDIYKAEASKVGERADDFLYPFFSYSGKDYYFINLPQSIQKRLVRERINYYDRLNDVISSAVVQKYTADKRNPKAKNEFEKLPDIVSFYSDLIEKGEVEKIYNSNKSKFKKDHDKNKVMLDIRVQLLTQRIVEYTQKTITKLHKENKYVFDNRNPFMPLEWFKIPTSPKISKNKDPQLKIDILFGYGCEGCGELAEAIGNIFKSYDSNKVSLTLHHYSNSFLDKSYYLNKAAMCVHEQDKDMFWKFNLRLLQKNAAIRLLKDNDLDKVKEVFMNILKNEEYSNLDKSSFNECLKEERKNKKGFNISKIASHLQVIHSNFNFLNGLSVPIVMVNGKRLSSRVPISVALRAGVDKGWFQIK